MAKTGLGKGLGALLSENVNIEVAPQTQSVIKEINTKPKNVSKNEQGSALVYTLMVYVTSSVNNKIKVDTTK